MLAICFAAPVSALMLSVYLKEKMAPTMTPSTSRSAQLVLVLVSIVMGAVVGCFCQFSNTEAKERQEIVRTGWNNILIIQDKSGSMDSIASTGTSRNDMASKAIAELLNKIEGEPQVGLLIDVDWGFKPLETRYVPMAPLTPAQRNTLIQKSQIPCTGIADFKLAVETVCSILSAKTDLEGGVTVLIVSDGVDYHQDDSTKSFKAGDYIDKLKQLGATVNYIYVNQDYSGEMAKLAAATNGQSYFAERSEDLLNQMQKVSTVVEIDYIYKDALRDINDSNTARIVTGIMLLILGALIGLSLTVMLSNQGQKRFQLILSPLMAIAAFAVLIIGREFLPEAWIREGVAFSLLGIVLMKTNLQGSAIKKNTRDSIDSSGHSHDLSVEETW